MNWRTAAAIGLSILFPIAIWLGRSVLEPRWLAVLPVLIIVLRGPRLWREPSMRLLAGATLILVAIAVWSNSAAPLRAYPVLVNLAFLIIFGVSLIHPPSIIERIARLTEPDLPDEGITYTRHVTMVWCAFFVFNGSISAATAVYASERVWALYNGVISYVMIALLFSGEWLVRQRVRSRGQHA